MVTRRIQIMCPASVLSAVALCVLLAATSCAQPKSSRSDKGREDKKEATKAQTTTRDTGGRQQSSPFGTSARRTDTVTKASAPSVRIETKPETPRMSSPKVSAVSTYRPTNVPDRSGAGRKDSSPASIFKSEPKPEAPRVERRDPTPVNTRTPGTRTEPVRIERKDPTPVSVYQPQPKNEPVRIERKDPTPVSVYRPQPKNEPVRIERKDPTPVSVFKPEPRNDAPRTGQRGPDVNPVTVKRPEAKPEPVVTRERDSVLDRLVKPQDRGAKTYRPEAENRSDPRLVREPKRVENRTPERSRPDVSVRPRGVKVTYKPSSNTTYRSRIGRDYYRPAKVYVERNSVQYYQTPKSYFPPRYDRGRYHYTYQSHHQHWNRPHFFGFWVFSLFPDFCVRSVYFHYGYYPYITVTRVYQTYYPEVVYVDRPIYVSGGYYLESSRYRALDDALADVRSAWISGRYDLIQRHVAADDKIAIFLDGSYDYSVDGQDFLGMTRDALETLQTVSFTWDKVSRRADDTVTAFGTHRYYGRDGDVRTVYVSYTLDKIGSQYYIVEVGSSLDPLY